MILKTAAATSALFLTLDYIRPTNHMLCQAVTAASNSTERSLEIDVTKIDAKMLACAVESGPATDSDSMNVRKAASEIICILRGIECNEKFCVA